MQEVNVHVHAQWLLLSGIHPFSTIMIIHIMTIMHQDSNTSVKLIMTRGQPPLVMTYELCLPHCMHLT